MNTGPKKGVRGAGFAKPTKPAAALAFFAFVACFVAALVVLNRPVPGEAATAASKLEFAFARVSAVSDDAAYPDAWTEGLRLGTQSVSVTINSGEHRGETFDAVNYLNAYSNVDLSPGARIIVRLDQDENGATYIASISSYNRLYALCGLALAFAAAIVAVGGKKGVAALAGLVFTVACIWFVLIPLLRRGFSPIPGALIITAVTTAVSLIFLGGFTNKTLCAALGCVGGTAIAGLAAWVTGIATPIGGFNMQEAEELVLRAADSGLQIRGLLVSGILIASLGAVMDVAMTLTSAVFELHERAPALTRRELFRSGLNVGRDAMGTMANTLILAFAGTSLNMLVLFRVFDYPYIQVFNSDVMAIEIIRGLAGSIGIVLTVPFVAALSAAFCGGALRGKPAIGNSAAWQARDGQARNG